MKLSIIIPVYNEEATIKTIIKMVEDAPVVFEKEIIVVDDASSDRTRLILEKIPRIRLLTHARNLGKGAAVKTGFLAATGDIVLIQDADLEYDPQDYPRLIKPILDKKADVVFGSRFRGEYQRVLFFWHYVGNLMLTVLSNMFTNINISDMETGYKAFHKDVIRSIAPKLQSRRFGIEPELTARVAHGGPALPDGSRGTWRIYEVPISYSGRTYKEGKKIQWWDGVKAIGAIIYFNVFSR